MKDNIENNRKLEKLYISKGFVVIKDCISKEILEESHSLLKESIKQNFLNNKFKNENFF